MEANVPLWMACLYVLLAGTLVFLCFSWMKEVGKEERARQIQAKHAQVEQDLIRRGQELEARHRRYQLAAEAEVKAAAIEAARKTEEATQLAVAAARELAELRFRTQFSVDNPEAMDKVIKERQMAFTKPGYRITVRVIALPTGRVAMEWMLDPAVKSYNGVMCWRDDKIVFDMCPVEGKGDHVEYLRPGREYLFSFRVVERPYTDYYNLQFVVRIPTEEELARSVTPAPKIDQSIERAAKIAEEIARLRSEHDAWDQVLRETDIDPNDTPDERRRKGARRAGIMATREKFDRE